MSQELIGRIASSAAMPTTAAKSGFFFELNVSTLFHQLVSRVLSLLRYNIKIQYCLMAPSGQLERRRRRRSESLEACPCRYGLLGELKVLLLLSNIDRKTNLQGYYVP